MAKEKRKIVVMGGSFNPPTLAHYRLLSEAIDALGADIGFFVPVSDAYLKRKMRHSHPPVVLSPELRVKMLQTMCTDSRMRVCEIEIGTIEARTIPTLKEIQEEYPDAELYFVMGADKTNLLINLTEKRGFMDMFSVVLYSREGMALEKTLKNNKVLSRYLNRIVTLPQPEGIDTISSSLVRERMLTGESSQELLCPGVWELFKEFTQVDFPDAIFQFKDEYAFLNICFKSQFVWQGVKYESAWAAFLSSMPEQKEYANCPAQDAQISIMESILKAKFEQNPSVMQKLADTGNCILINGHNKHETFWGTNLYSWLGDNHLGRLLMRIREGEKQK